MTRHIGAFVTNVLKPLIEELDKLLGKCKHLKLTKKDINSMMLDLISLEVYKTKWYCILYLVLGSLFCLTVYFILK